MKYTPAQKQAAYKLIKERLDKAFELNSTAIDTIQPQQAICFFLDKYIAGDYYGNVNIRILGNRILDPKETEITHRLDEDYRV